MEWTFSLLCSPHTDERGAVLRIHGSHRYCAGRVPDLSLAEKGGEETLEKEIRKDRVQKVYRKFKKRGFASVLVTRRAAQLAFQQFIHAFD